MADDGASTLVVLNAGDTASAPLTVQLPQGKLANSVWPDPPCLTVLVLVGMALQLRRAAASTATK